MKSQVRIVLPVVSLCFAAVAVFVFFTLHDPDTVTHSVTRWFAWGILFPAAIVFGSFTRYGFWLSGLGMLFGLTVGMCVRFLIPPLESNIWPIAAIIWTALFLLPIVVGSVIGGLFRWCTARVVPR